MFHWRQHHWSMLVKMFDFLCEVPGVLPSTDVLFSEFLLLVQPHCWSHPSVPVYVGNSRGWDGLLAAVSASPGEAHSVNSPWDWGGQGQHSHILVPPPGCLLFICAALLCTLVFLLSLCAARAAEGLCLLQQRWLKYKDGLNFYPECSVIDLQTPEQREVQGGGTEPHTLYNAVIICSLTVE